MKTPKKMILREAEIVFKSYDKAGRLVKEEKQFYDPDPNENSVVIGFTSFRKRKKNV